MIIKITEKFLRGLGLQSIDAAQLWRFGLVGVFVATLYFVLSVLIVDIFDLVSWVGSAIAYVIAIIVQYILQTVFTFRESLEEKSQAFKFFVTVLSGLIFSVLVTGVIWPLTEWPEWWAYLIVIVTLPITNYIVFKYWVYRKL